MRGNALLELRIIEANSLGKSLHHNMLGSNSHPPLPSAEIDLPSALTASRLQDPSCASVHATTRTSIASRLEREHVGTAIQGTRKTRAEWRGVCSRATGKIHFPVLNWRSRRCLGCNSKGETWSRLMCMRNNRSKLKCTCGYVRIGCGLGCICNNTEIGRRLRYTCIGAEAW